MPEIGPTPPLGFTLYPTASQSHDHKGYSEEKCMRCGWVMGHPPLNCMNDDTPHRFPSQVEDEDVTDDFIDRLEQAAQACSGPGWDECVWHTVDEFCYIMTLREAEFSALCSPDRMLAIVKALRALEAIAVKRQELDIPRDDGGVEYDWRLVARKQENLARQSLAELRKVDKS